MLKKVKVGEAIGMALAHDVTKIIPGTSKEPAFRKGHAIEEKDISQLLSLGKEHVWVLELSPGEVHEEEAAIRIAKAVSGLGLEWAEPREGRVNIRARSFGLFKVNVSLLEEVNSVEDVILATLHDNSVCHPQMVVAGTKIIPLVTAETKLREVEALCKIHGKVIEVLPFKKKRVGVVITGNEVFAGRVEDAFSGVIQKKLEPFGLAINYKLMAPDDIDLIAQAIADLKSEGCEIILACGGMSIDPDDVTRQGIEKAGAIIAFYGTPVIPGTMFLYATLEDTPVLGLPGGVIHDPTTVFDLLLPRVLADEPLSRQNIMKLGHGGLCLRCDDCFFPVCPFGK
jgi:hypothetical protein